MQAHLQHTIVTVICVVVACIALTGCPNKKTDPEKSKTAGRAVVASNYPLKYFVEQLVGDQIPVIAPAGQPPRTWNPSDETIAQIQKADIIFTHGAGYEEWLNYLSFDDTKVVEAPRRLFKKFIQIQGEVHKHGPEGEEHAHDGLANYFWLSPDLAIGEVNRIAESLVETYPELKESISTNQSKLVKELEALKSSLEKRDKAELVVFASDPRFAYLARDLGWKHIYFHWTNHGKEELPEQAWNKFEQQLSEQKPQLMLWPIEPSADIKKELESRNIRVVVLDSIETSTADKNYLQRLKSVIELAVQVEGE